MTTHTPQKTGILLAQLGTPDDATPKSVRRFLKEFLWDPRVIDINRFLWFFILHFFILVFRPKKSARLYKRLFDKHGPILKTLSESLKSKLQQIFQDRNLNVTVEYGMRYGHPCLKTAFKKMVTQKGCSQILVVPLFPQYSHTTTSSVFDAIMQENALIKEAPKIKFMPPFYKESAYIASLCENIEKNLKDASIQTQKIIISYHGIPKRYVDNGDPYFEMCCETSRLIKQQLNFPKDDIVQTFQSRLGKSLWLQPYTDKTLINLAQNKIKHVMVLCPSFTMDCLETLDEIAIENKNLFIKNGGESLTLISCLNDNNVWVNRLYELINHEINLQDPKFGLNFHSSEA